MLQSCSNVVIAPDFNFSFIMILGRFSSQDEIFNCSFSFQINLKRETLFFLTRLKRVYIGQVFQQHVFKTSVFSSFSLFQTIRLIYQYQHGWKFPPQTANRAVSPSFLLLESLGVFQLKQVLGIYPRNQNEEHYLNFQTLGRLSFLFV